MLIILYVNISVPFLSDLVEIFIFNIHKSNNIVRYTTYIKDINTLINTKTKHIQYKHGKNYK